MKIASSEPPLKLFPQYISFPVTIISAFPHHEREREKQPDNTPGRNKDAITLTYTSTPAKKSIHRQYMRRAHYIYNYSLRFPPRWSPPYIPWEGVFSISLLLYIYMYTTHSWHARAARTIIYIRGVISARRRRRSGETSSRVRSLQATAKLANSSRPIERNWWWWKKEADYTHSSAPRSKGHGLPEWRARVFYTHIYKCTRVYTAQHSVKYAREAIPYSE